MVEDVERIHPELEMEAFLDHELLLYRHIEVQVGWSVEEVDARLQSDTAGRWREEASRIEAVGGSDGGRARNVAGKQARAGRVPGRFRKVLRACSLKLRPPG